MIKIKIISPLPNMLRLSNDTKTLIIELPYQKKMTTGIAMDRIAETLPEFQKLWAMKQCLGLQQCLIAINGVVIEKQEKWSIELRDDEEIVLFLQYVGG